MAKRLPLWGKLAYGIGAGGFSLIDRIMVSFLLHYYLINPIKGETALVVPLAFGMVMFLGRVVDAVADPLIARWSDNHRGRLGRRIPFMLYSGIFYVAVFIALFYPPVAATSSLNFIYLTLMLGLYFALFTAYVCPYLALLPELARSNKDRVDLSTWKAVFSILGVAVAFVGGGILIDSLGIYGMLWVMGGIGLVMLYIPALFIRERDYAQSEPATLGLRDALNTTFKNRPFLIYLAGNVAFWLGFNIVTLNIAPYVTVLLGGTEGDVAIYFGLVMAVALLCFPLVNIYSKKLGLKTVMLFSMILFALLLPGIYFLGQSVWGLTPRIFGYVLMALMGIPVSAIFVVPDAIVAAVSDLEEKLSGQRREAMYFGAQGFILKLALGLSTLITTGLLQFFGRTPEQALGIRLTGPVATLFIIIGALIFSHYPEKEVIAYQEDSIGP
ncbi:MAG: MFS transporter [Firmicutes bacterium]|nr:MFS transporter [Bacillota bacterium]